MSDPLDDLLARARALPPMTDDERAEQQLDFTYGNLALSTHHKPVKAAFAAASRRFGWSEERFELWAAGRAWRTL
jgi:hypothetical protein